MTENRRSAAFVGWIVRHGKALWLVALLLALPATWRTIQLYAHLKSDIEQLLPRESPSVRAVDELRSRIAGIRYLGVVVDVGRPENLSAGERLLDDLAVRIRNYPAGLVRSVRLGDTEERKFLENHAPLYLSREDLGSIHERIVARRDYEVSQGLGISFDETEKAPSLDFSDIQKKYDNKTKGRDRFPSGRFSNADMHRTLLLIQLGGFDTGASRGKELFERVRRDMADLGGPTAYAPGMRFGFSGDVAISVEETAALMADLSLSSILVMFAVIGVIIVYFRWFRSVLVLLPPLLLAAVYSFACASLPPFRVTELNSNTAFLGSIIVGNGINFSIILLARYVEERRAGRDVQSSLVLAVAGSRTGTLAAALAAGVSYAALALTQFRGFRQFGYIGGIGMVFAWLTAYVLLPPLVTWVDRGSHTAPQPGARKGYFTAGVSWFVGRYPVVCTAIAVLLTLASLWKVRGFGPDQLEYDFSKLRRGDTWVSGEGYWGRLMDGLLGEYLTPMVILTDTPAEAASVAGAVREAARGPLQEQIATVRTVDDIVPPDQPAKLAIIQDIRRDVTPRMRAQLTEPQRADFDRLIGSGSLRPFAAEELPSTFTTGMRERDGSLDRAVLIYPKFSNALWKGEPIMTFVSSLRALAQETGTAKPGRLAGSLPLSADILSSIKRDGLVASFAAFVGVVVVVVFLLRWHLTTVHVIASLAIGVLWLLGAILALRIKVNFANFIAFPITFGIGVDYAVNIMSRYAQEGSKDILSAVRSSGSAVTLCSLTTIIGYSSLLLAENRALYLFGLIAVLGEVACLTAALVALPALLLTLRNWRQRRAGVTTA